MRVSTKSHDEQAMAIESKMEKMNMNKHRLTVLVAMVLTAAMSRLLPHPPNLTPLAALALFGGANFAGKRTAFLVPLAALFLTDLFLGFSVLTPGDAQFIGSLPAGVDPCGENGEFHSFAFAGPIFRSCLRIKVGETIYRPVEETHPGSNATSSVCPPPGARRTKGFWFCDLLPA
jgi:uncharacterized protein DUF6580/diphthamide synthase